MRYRRSTRPARRSGNSERRGQGRGSQGPAGTPRAWSERARQDSQGAWPRGCSYSEGVVWAWPEIAPEAGGRGGIPRGVVWEQAL